MEPQQLAREKRALSMLGGKASFRPEPEAPVTASHELSVIRTNSPHLSPES